MSRYPVFLNVYDMYWINQYTFPVGLGVFHSGVVVHGKEYAYGGHPYSWSGIFDMSPKSVNTLGEDFKYRETLTIGTTSLTPDQVEDLVKAMGLNYEGRSYHLIDKKAKKEYEISSSGFCLPSRNCNHFTSEFCQALCNKPIPGWINRLASVSSYLPFLLKCLPREWITPEACSPHRISHPFHDFAEQSNDEQDRRRSKST